MTERTPRGLEECLSADGETTATVGDTIIDPVAEQAYERVLDKIEIGEVRELAAQLDERERGVLQAHYGLVSEPAQTLNQIGGALGLTAERARQIEVGAQNKLGEVLSLSACAGDQTTCTRTSIGLLDLSRSRSAMRARIGFIDVAEAEPRGRNRAQPAARGSSTWIFAAWPEVENQLGAPHPTVAPARGLSLPGVVGQ